MDNRHRIDVLSFTGESTATMIEAHDRAAVALQAWYAKQVILFTADKATIFEFSTAAYRDGARHVFIITVFDTRHRPG